MENMIKKAPVNSSILHPIPSGPSYPIQPHPLPSPTQSGTLFLFNVRYDRPWLWFELPVFALVGAVVGVVGAALVTLNLRCVIFFG
jgi:hypothetical protein